MLFKLSDWELLCLTMLGRRWGDYVEPITSPPCLTVNKYDRFLAPESWGEGYTASSAGNLEGCFLQSPGRVWRHIWTHGMHQGRFFPWQLSDLVITMVLMILSDYLDLSFTIWLTTNIEKIQITNNNNKRNTYWSIGQLIAFKKVMKKKKKDKQNCNWSCKGNFYKRLVYYRIQTSSLGKHIILYYQSP